jgi:hypothetical protein
VDQQTLPQKLYLLGGGRHPSTRALRRVNRFRPRVFDIGELTIRPNRRVDVTVEFVLKHFDAIVQHVNNGTLIVQHSADRLVDVDELHAIRAVARGEVPQGPIVKLTAEDESDDDAIDNPEDDGTHQDPALADADPNPAAVAFGEPEAALEPVEAQEEPQEAPEVDPFDEPSLDTTDLLEPEPAPEPMEELADLTETVPVVMEAAADVVEAEPEQRWLPEGFEKLHKKELLGLCTERGIEVESTRTNEKQLVRLLRSWKKG